MKQPIFLLTALAAATAFPGASPAFSAEAPAAGTPTPLQLDAETTVNGIGIACTGIGEIKNDPRWSAYPVRVEFANERHEYLIGAVVTLADRKGTELLNISCEAPWVLLKLPDRSSYRLSAQLTDMTTAPQVRTVKAPAQGQIHVVITFPGT